MIFGAWIGILSQICEIFESRYLEKYARDQHEIWRGISDARSDAWVVQQYKIII